MTLADVRALERAARHLEGAEDEPARRTYWRSWSLAALALEARLRRDPRQALYRGEVKMALHVLWLMRHMQSIPSQVARHLYAEARI